MEEPFGKGLATHPEPESCAAYFRQNRNGLFVRMTLLTMLYEGE